MYRTLTSTTCGAKTVILPHGLSRISHYKMLHRDNLTGAQFKKRRKQFKKKRKVQRNLISDIQEEAVYQILQKSKVERISAKVLIYRSAMLMKKLSNQVNSRNLH